MPESPASTTSARSQTLHRGLVVLETLAHTRESLTVAELSTETRLHRSIVYRLLRTLEDHHFVTRGAGDTYRLGHGLTLLARSLTGDLEPVARPFLQELADATDLAAFVVVREGDEAVTVLVVEPRAPGPMFTQGIGHRHPVTAGAPGIALQCAARPGPDEPAPVAQARARGWARSHGEVLDNVSSVSVPLTRYGLPAAVAVTYVGHHDPEHLAGLLGRAAREIDARL